MTSDPTEPPCIGLDPDTYECPFCGAGLDDECGAPSGGWRVGPGDATEVQQWTGSAWATDSYCPDAAAARRWVLAKIRETRANA